LPELIPFRWPADWRDPSKLALVENTPFNCALIAGDAPVEIAAALRNRRITVVTNKDTPATVLSDTRWPQIQTGAHGQVDTGPTGNPWMDSNGFAILAARAQTPGKPVWLEEDPPKNAVVRPDDYCLALADAAAYGGHWLPSLECPAWHSVAGAAQFFESHREWRNYKPIARLAIVSDFAPSRRDFVLEVLNLLDRLGTPFSLVTKPGAVDSNRFALVVNLDQRDSSSDPWEAANEIRDKLGRRHDVVRLWNGATINAYYAAAPNGGPDLLQLINYAARKSDEAVTAGVMSNYRSARIYTLENSHGAPITLRRARSGVEMDLPPFAIYAAIELIR